MAFNGGRARSKGAPELALLTISDPVRAEPEMAVAAETILSIIRFVQRKQDKLPLIRALLSAYAGQVSSKGKKSNFPARRFFDAVKVIWGYPLCGGCSHASCCPSY